MINRHRLWYLIFRRPRRWPSEVKWFIQRGRRGYADCDVWGLDYYIEEVLIGAIKQLREIHIGYPAEPGMTPRKWKGIMTRIINGLEGWKEFEEDAGAALFWMKRDRKGYQKEYRKRLKGRHDAIKLFGKYFSNFWD